MTDDLLTDEERQIVEAFRARVTDGPTLLRQYRQEKPHLFTLLEKVKPGTIRLVEVHAELDVCLLDVLDKYLPPSPIPKEKPDAPRRD